MQNVFSNIQMSILFMPQSRKIKNFACPMLWSNGPSYQKKTPQSSEPSDNAFLIMHLLQLQMLRIMVLAEYWQRKETLL